MRDFKFYEAFLEEIKTVLENDDISFPNFVEKFEYGEGETLEIEVLGESLILSKETLDANSYQVARLDDPIQFAYLRLKGDDLILYEEGFYDSWNGGEYDGEVRVGRLASHTIEYPAEVRS